MGERRGKRFRYRLRLRVKVQWGGGMMGRGKG